MGEPRNAHSVKLFTGLLAREDDRTLAEKTLTQDWGPIDFRSESFPFDYSHYYDDELGTSAIRWFISFKILIDPESIREYKVQSNTIEKFHSVDAGRRFNIDPGYIDLDKVVLGTTKNATYRIYLGKGIYAQSMLYYKAGQFVSWPWTYRDYQDPRALEFFKKVRMQFKDEMNEAIRKSHGSNQAL